jgi:hypothetical protein
MNKLIAVRKEYGESFVDVVKGFAAQGNSRTLTARTLGFNLSYFRQLCSRFDLHKHFKPQGEMRDECKQGNLTGRGFPKGGARLYLRAPIVHKGITFVPGEPMHHYLFSRRKNANVQVRNQVR